MPRVRETTYSDVTLRPFEPGDLEFLYQVYASSRAEEMAVLIDWNDEQKEEFLRFQFEAQHQHYQAHYPRARYDIIVKGEEDIGRFYVERMQNEIRIMDIALLPERRGQGVGRALVQEVLDEAERHRKFVSLHVEEHNLAKRLYERMGFVEAGEVTFYKLMHWVPAGLTPIHEGDTVKQDPGSGLR